MAPDKKSLVRSLINSLFVLLLFSLANWLLFRYQLFMDFYLVLYNLIMFILGLYLILNHRQFSRTDRGMLLCVFVILVLEILLVNPAVRVRPKIFIVNSAAYFVFFTTVTFIPLIYQRFRIRLNETMTRDVYSPLLEKILKTEQETGRLKEEVSLIEQNKEDVAYIFDVMKDVNTKMEIGEVFSIIREVFVSRMNVDNLVVILKTTDKPSRAETDRHSLFHNIDENMRKYIDYIEDKANHFFYLSNLPSYTLRISDDWAALENAMKIPYETFVLIPFYMQKTNRGFIGFFLKNASVLHQEWLNFAIFAVHNLSLALNKMMLFEKLKTLSTLDGLTKLYLHRIFMEKLDNEFLRAKRYGKNLSLLMMDIDHFKRFNDNYGHLVGDNVLKSVGDHILASIDKDMLPARYGGEEFAIICPEPQDVDTFTKNLKKAIQEDSLESEKGEKLRITISIGIADLTPDVPDAKTLIKRADDSLYHAKKNGRDMIVHYPEKIIR